jgi:hypothetical protein
MISFHERTADTLAAPELESLAVPLRFAGSQYTPVLASEYQAGLYPGVPGALTDDGIAVS